VRLPGTIAKILINHAKAETPDSARRIRISPAMVGIKPLEPSIPFPPTFPWIRYAVLVLKRPFRIAHPAI
jgi:hypothetical protein